MKLELDLTEELWNELNPCWDDNLDNQNIGWKPRPDIIIVPIMSRNLIDEIDIFSLKEPDKYCKSFLIQVEGFEPNIRPIKNEHLVVEDNGNTYVVNNGEITTINTNVVKLRRVK